MPISWIGDQITTWLGGLSAVAVLIGAGRALSQRAFDQAAYLGAACILISIVNYWRLRMMRRKKAEFLAATVKFETAIRSAFD